jgi:hypothetical protein
MAHEIVKVHSAKALVQKKQPSFQVAVRHIPNQHKAQFFIDYGNNPGPWLLIAFNNTAYGFGYLPKKKKERPRGQISKARSRSADRKPAGLRSVTEVNPGRAEPAA